MVYFWIALAAIFSVIMDKCETEISFNASKFHKLNKYFWCKPISSNKPLVPFTHYRVDAWHLAKSCMIICICAAVSCNITQFIILGLIWNITFNFLYKHL